VDTNWVGAEEDGMIMKATNIPATPDATNNPAIDPVRTFSPVWTGKMGVEEEYMAQKSLTQEQ
jgi:hypothetical protein